GAESVAQLEAQRKQKTKELDAHVAGKPPAVEQPGSLGPEQQATIQKIADELAEERAKLGAIEADIAAGKARQKTLTEHLALARKLESKIANFEAEHARLVQDTQTDFKTLSLDVNKIVTLTVDKTTLNTLRDTITAEKNTIDASLSEEHATSLPRQAAAC